MICIPTIQYSHAKLLKDTLDNVALRKGELDELGGAILKQSTAVATPQEDDEKPKDEEQDTNEGDGLDATSVKQDRNGGTLVHEEEALNATLENIKGTGSSSSSIDIGTSSATPGYDDTSSTTTAGTSNPNNIRQSVPSADTEAHDDEEEALLDRPLRRLSGAVNPLSVNINVSLYSREHNLVIDIVSIHRRNALQKSYWIIRQNLLVFGMDLTVSFQHLPSLLNNPKS